MLAVQIVVIRWTKATRGAPRSLERAALPRAFPFDGGGAAGVCVVQQHRLAEDDGFAPKLVREEVHPDVPRVVDDLRIAPDTEGAFRVGFFGTRHGGQPKRRMIREALQVAPGEWVRLVVNARHTSYAGQHYTETVYNIACGEPVPADRFLRGLPDHELDLQAHLF